MAGAKDFKANGKPRKTNQKQRPGIMLPSRHDGLEVIMDVKERRTSSVRINQAVVKPVPAILIQGQTGGLGQGCPSCKRDIAVDRFLIAGSVSTTPAISISGSRAVAVGDPANAEPVEAFYDNCRDGDQSGEYAQNVREEHVIKSAR